MVKNIKSFFMQFVQEASNIAWPTRTEIKNNLILIIVVSVALGVFIGIVQFGVERVLKLIIESQR